MVPAKLPTWDFVMPIEQLSTCMDTRLAAARELMIQALQLLDDASCYQPAAIMDHAIHALAQLERGRAIAAMFMAPIL